MKAESPKVTLLQRAIPSSTEKLPVIGLGSWQVFDVGPDRSERQPLEAVLARFVALGGRVVDSSPMYGRAEQVIGEIVAKLGLRDSLFLATKVWTTGKDEGVASMERSFARLETERLDLMQVHNLVDAKTQLATLRSWQKGGRIRYVGITHYTSSAYSEVARLLRSEKVDFLQINYSLGEREAEKRFFPWPRNAAWRCSPIVLLAAVTFFLASAKGRCPNGLRNSIANPGRSFFSNGLSPIRPSHVLFPLPATFIIWKIICRRELGACRMPGSVSEWPKP
jgi:aryl-alcohol dehydrogenase-like predicted oxidoreductase